ncbi:hypothetical protein MCEMSEM22_01723 [Comamonadaceae bacterium]
MTKHLPSQLQIALTLPTGMSDGGGFAVATQSAKSMLFYVACHSPFAPLRRHRMVMAAEITRLQPLA